MLFNYVGNSTPVPGNIQVEHAICEQMLSLCRSFSHTLWVNSRL